MENLLHIIWRLNILRRILWMVKLMVNIWEFFNIWGVKRIIEVYDVNETNK